MTPPTDNGYAHFSFCTCGKCMARSSLEIALRLPKEIQRSIDFGALLKAADSDLYNRYWKKS